MTSTDLQPPADAARSQPAHIEQTVLSIARLHAQHESRATGLQRLTDRLTAAVARPAFIGWLSLFVLAWAAANFALQSAHRPAFDPAPYDGLQGLLTIIAVGLTSLILTTQRRADELASQREQLTLELAILSEQKAAKIIELLEEQRRDSSSLPNRTDASAEAMAMPANPEAVLDAIRESHAQVAASSDGGDGQP